MDTDFTFTFSTGITVPLRRVSPFLVNELDRAFPPPEPPLQEVTLDGETKMEPNPADPDYAARLFEYHLAQRERRVWFIVRRGVVLDANEIRPAVDAVRAEWKTAYGLELETDDVLVAYIKYVCVGTGDDLTNLIGAITGRSQPTEREVSAEAKSFQGDVQGA